VEKTFYPPFEQAAGVYVAGEVFEGNPTTICDYQNYMDGMLNFPSYDLDLCSICRYDTDSLTDITGSLKPSSPHLVALATFTTVSTP
jgi:hypothetical protein